MGEGVEHEIWHQVTALGWSITFKNQCEMQQKENIAVLQAKKTKNRVSHSQRMRTNVINRRSTNTEWIKNWRVPAKIVPKLPESLQSTHFSLLFSTFFDILLLPLTPYTTMRPLSFDFSFWFSFTYVCMHFFIKNVFPWNLGIAPVTFYNNYPLKQLTNHLLTDS